MYISLVCPCSTFRFTFKNKNNVTVRIINYGGIITDILVPDKNGKVVDINLEFDDIKGIFLNYIINCHYVLFLNV